MNDFEAACQLLDKCLKEITYFLRLIYSRPFDLDEGSFFDLEDFFYILEKLVIGIVECDTIFVLENGVPRKIEADDPVPPKEYGVYIIDDQGNYIRVNSFIKDDVEAYDPLYVINNTRVFRHRIVERLCLKLVEHHDEELNELTPLHAKKIEIGIWRKLNAHEALDHLDFFQEISRTRLSTDQIERDLNVQIYPSREIYMQELNIRLIEYRDIAMAYLASQTGEAFDQRSFAFAQAVARLMVPEADVPWKVLFREHMAFMVCSQKIGSSFIEIAELLADYRSPIYREISRAEVNEYLISLIFIERPEYQQVSVPSFCDVSAN